MPASRASATAIAPSRGAPLDREAVLARTPPERQKLYRLVRQILDDLESAAAWDLLYYPPDSAEELLSMLDALLGVVDGIPGRLRELIAALSVVATDDETRATLEEADFYYAGIHGMCAHDLARLRGLLEPLDAPGAAAPTASERTFLCEVAADLKGKYGSALMGATTSIVAAGLWTSAEVEPVLFPEKADEPKRNDALAVQLRRALEAITELPAQVPFAELAERWRSRARVDPYALADLSTFRGVLGQLLKRNVRRALYSGDYHQIQRREKALASRVAALEVLHDSTWSDAPDDAQMRADTYSRLVGLTLEVAAIVDVDLLETLVGERAVKDLRMAVTSDREVASSGKGKRKPLSAELEPLVALLAEEDLQTFLELLLGSVLKRATFSRERAPAPAAPLLDDLDDSFGEGLEGALGVGATDEELLPSLELVAVEPEPPPPAKPAKRAAAPPPPAAAGPKPAAAKEPAARPAAVPAPAPASAEKRREILGGLDRMLAGLQSPSNPNYGGFRMLQRLVGRHARLPPSMVQAAHPFFFEVLNELVPQLEAAAAIGAVPAEARAKLVECCLALTDQALAPDQMAAQVPAQLARLQRLLEALTSATAGQLRSLGG